jgi:hypothetical protein
MTEGTCLLFRGLDAFSAASKAVPFMRAENMGFNPCLSLAIATPCRGGTPEVMP